MTVISWKFSSPNQHFLDASCQRRDTSLSRLTWTPRSTVEGSFLSPTQMAFKLFHHSHPMWEVWVYASLALRFTEGWTSSVLPKLGACTLAVRWWHIHPCSHQPLAGGVCPPVDVDTRSAARGECSSPARNLSQIGNEVGWIALWGSPAFCTPAGARFGELRRDVSLCGG